MGSISGIIYVKGQKDKEIPYRNQIVFETRDSFPAVGDPGLLYVASDEDKIYRYDDQRLEYVALTMTADEIKFINGGI